MSLTVSPISTTRRTHKLIKTKDKVPKSVDRRSPLQKLAAMPHIVWMIIFIVAPMIFVVYFAFTDENGFSLSNITGLAQYSNVFILSIAFALIATVICLIIGYPLAYFIAKAKN